MARSDSDQVGYTTWSCENHCDATVAGGAHWDRRSDKAKSTVMGNSRSKGSGAEQMVIDDESKVNQATLLVIF